MSKWHDCHLCPVRSFDITDLRSSPTWLSPGLNVNRHSRDEMHCVKLYGTRSGVQKRGIAVVAHTAPFTAPLRLSPLVEPQHYVDTKCLLETKLSLMWQWPILLSPEVARHVSVCHISLACHVSRTQLTIRYKIITNVKPALRKYTY